MLMLWFHVKKFILVKKTKINFVNKNNNVSSVFINLDTKRNFCQLDYITTSGCYSSSSQYVVAACCGCPYEGDGFTKKFGGITSMVDHTIDCNSFDLNEQKKESPPELTSRDQWRIVGPPTRDGATIQKGCNFSVTRISFIQINKKGPSKGLMGFLIDIYIVIYVYNNKNFNLLALKRPFPLLGWIKWLPTK